MNGTLSLSLSAMNVCMCSLTPARHHASCFRPQTHWTDNKKRYLDRYIYYRPAFAYTPNIGLISFMINTSNHVPLIFMVSMQVCVRVCARRARTRYHVGIARGRWMESPIAKLVSQKFSRRMHIYIALCIWKHLLDKAMRAAAARPFSAIDGKKHSDAIIVVIRFVRQRAAKTIIYTVYSIHDSYCVRCAGERASQPAADIYIYIRVYEQMVMGIVRCKV